jgi:cytochrome o ubiquinol oxidase operon protein cyoD
MQRRICDGEARPLAITPESIRHVLTLAFGVFIVSVVVIGSLWIMTNLNDSMMPAELMDMRMPH